MIVIGQPAHEAHGAFGHFTQWNQLGTGNLRNLVFMRLTDIHQHEFILSVYDRLEFFSANFLNPVGLHAGFLLS